MKRLSSFMGRAGWSKLVPAFLIALFGVSSLCVGQTYNGFSYTVSGAAITITAFNISGYSPPGGAVTIPSTIPGVNGTVTSIAEAAFDGCSGLTSVTIPDSVTSIGWFAFADCSRLTAIAVDAQNPYYSSIGGVLFDKGLDTLFQYPAGRSGAYAIPNGVTGMGPRAFAGCSGLTSVTIPNGVTGIAREAFVGCTGLTSVTLPTSVSLLADGAFAECGRLTSVYCQGDAPDCPWGFPYGPFEGDNNATAYYLPGTTGWSPYYDGVPSVYDLIPTVELSPPVAGPSTYARPANMSLKIAISDLLANVTVTAGDYVTLAGVGTDGVNLVSANGTTLFTNSTYILYPGSVTPNVNDSFEYTVKDAVGQTAIGTVLIVINNDATGQTSPKLVVTSTSVTATFFGVPGYRYTVDRSTDVTQGLGWVPIRTLTAPANGVMQVVDTFQDLGIPVPPLPAAAYYRLRYNP